MKIEVSNAPGDLDELYIRGTDLKDHLVEIATGRIEPKAKPIDTLELLEVYLDMLQVVGGLKLDVDRALVYQPKHTQFEKQ